MARLLTIMNSRALEDYTPSVERRTAARRQFNIDPDTILLINLARMCYRKGQDQLVRITAYLKEQGYNVRTIIMGPDWEFRPTLEQLVTELKLDGIVQLFEGSVEKGIQLLAAGDIFVFPSSREGLPGVLIEACAAGLPIIAYDVNSVREICSSANGRLIENGNYDGMKQAVLELVKDANLRKNCGETSLVIAAQKFSGEQMTRQYEKLFEQEAHQNVKLSEPTTTIIIPVWKRHKFLLKSINSVISQTSPKWRLIISVDDEKPEPQLKEILDTLTDNRISIIYGPHKNQCAAINRAVAAAQTEYCSRLDSDDTLSPVAVEILAQHIKLHPRIGYFYTAQRVIDENDSPIKEQNVPRETMVEDFKPTRLEEWYIARHWITWKVRDYAIAGGIAEDIEYGEDYLLALTMMLHGTKFMPIKECLYNWRDHDDGSIQKAYTKERSQAMIDKIRARYAEMKKIMGVSWEGEDPATIRPRTSYSKTTPPQVSDEQLKEYLWATPDPRRRKSFVLAHIKNTPSITAKEIGRIFHLALRTDNKLVVMKELTELFSKPIEYLGEARTKELREALISDKWISVDPLS